MLEKCEIHDKKDVIIFIRLPFILLYTDNSKEINTL